MRIVDGLVVALVLAGLAGCASSRSSTPAALSGGAAPASPAAAVLPPGVGGPALDLTQNPTLNPPLKPGGDLVPAVLGIPSGSGGLATMHRISAGDVLSVTVFQVADLSTEKRVNERGVIVLPLIGPIEVAGLTTEEAERRIEQALGRDYLQNPQVNIFVSEYANMNVTVGGEVRSPGVFPLTGQTSLMQAIAQAGGLTSLANPREVIVFRRAPGQELSAYVVDFKAVERGELTDPLLAAQDRVVVPQSGSRAFIKGAADTLRGFVQAVTF